MIILKFKRCFLKTLVEMIIEEPSHTRANRTELKLLIT